MKWNSFSSSTSCALVYAVRARLDEACPGGLLSPAQLSPELEPLVFCLVFCLDSFIQGKICLPTVGELSRGLLAVLAGVGLLLAL